MQKPPRITFRRLQVFIAIAETGGFGAAAEKLGMAQPSVSSHVEALEAQAGGALFQRRRGRGVVLTDLGSTFLRHARQLLDEADEMAVELHRSRAETERRVIFACQRSLADLLSPLLAEFAGQHRDIELIIRVGRQEEVVELIEGGTANLGLYLSNQDRAGLRSDVVGREELAIIASPRHSLARRNSIEPKELDNFSFVGAPEESLFGHGVAQLLSRIGVHKITLASRATEFEILRALVVADVGIYCCLRKRVQPDLDRGILVMLPLKAPPLMMDVRQVFSPLRSIAPAVALFAEFLRKHHRIERRARSKRASVPTLAPTGS